MKDMAHEFAKRIIIIILNCIVKYIIVMKKRKRRNKLSYFSSRYHWVAFSLIAYIIELL